MLPPLLTIKTHSRPPKEWLEGEKKSIITRSAGYDHLEALADVANITSLRNYCVNAVAPDRHQVHVLHRRSAEPVHREHRHL